MKTPALIVIAGLSFITTSFAVDPPPDGGYPNANTAEGEDALFSLTTGSNNTATGAFALYNTTTGSFNTAIGEDALYSNTTGALNTAVGYGALHTNSDKGGNTAIGGGTLYYNTTGEDNTAIGFNALGANVSGLDNTATGLLALSNNTSGRENVANGVAALTDNYTGNNNTAVGSFALQQNFDGHENTAVGYRALVHAKGGNNTAIGAHALPACEGDDNIGLGRYAGYNIEEGHDNIAIGNPGDAQDFSTIRIGNRQVATYVAGISDVTVADGVGVVIDSRGHLGTVTSSARFKEKIEPMARSSEAVLSLRPVTFRYKKELDPKAIPQFGLVAEDVAKVDPALVARDDEGKPYTVRYEAVNAMLLNEFLKEHQKVQEQAGEIAELRSELKTMNARLTANGL